jgi:hypothetical protein
VNDTKDLERMRRFGAYEERERITKLLEADMCSDWATQRLYCCDGACSAYNDVIDLIKGEQK